MINKIVTAPTDSQIMCNGFHYKLGSHGLIFRWNPTSGWRNTASAATKVVAALKRQELGDVSSDGTEVMKPDVDPFSGACPRLTKEGVWYHLTNMEDFATHNGVSVDDLFNLLKGSIKELKGFEWEGVTSKDPRARYLYYFKIDGATVPVFNLTKFAKVIDMELTSLRTYVRTGKLPNAALTAAGVEFSHRTKIANDHISASPWMEQAAGTRPGGWVATIDGITFYFKNLAAFARGLGVEYCHIKDYTAHKRPRPDLLTRLGIEISPNRN